MVNGCLMISTRVCLEKEEKLNQAQKSGLIQIPLFDQNEPKLFFETSECETSEFFSKISPSSTFSTAMLQNAHENTLIDDDWQFNILI